MIVYGVSLSPFVRKVLLVLKYKGLAFELKETLPGSTDPEYRKISPLGKIPAIQDGDLTICDSSVICEYLEEQYPEISLLPESTADRAKARWFEEFADSKLAELCGGGIFFEKVAKPLLLQQEPDQAKISATIDKKLPPILDYLESQMPQEGFLFADISIADISIASQFINAAYADYHIDEKRWPKLFNYIERIKSHPLVHQQLASEQESLAGITGN